MAKTDLQCTTRETAIQAIITYIGTIASPSTRVVSAKNALIKAKALLARYRTVN